MALTVTDDKGNLYDVLDGNLTIKAHPPVVVDIRPSNAAANANIPVTMGIVAFQTASMDILTSIRDKVKRSSYLSRVTGKLCPGIAAPTTRQLLLAGWAKWMPDMSAQSDYLLAQAVVESNWYQWRPDGTPSHGDVGNGDSWGIMQVKQRDNPATYPMSANSTGFNIDYYMMILAAVFNGEVAYLGENPAPFGQPAYLPATHNVQRLRLAIGAWYSGQWGDAGALSYLKQIDAVLPRQPWAQAGF